MSDQDRPDVPAVLEQLKDFQKQTVDHVFDRLYGANSTRRFLLADEVGLGKTLVAKGVIARAIEHLWDTVERIDVIYICSNADIARQNLTRLRPGGHGVALPTRITLLPLNAASLSENKLNFISFTPGTSLDPHSAMGTAEERALLLRLLREPWGLGHRKGPRKLFQGTVRTLENFTRTTDWVDGREISAELRTAFHKAVVASPDLRERFDELLSAYTASRDVFAMRQDVRDARRDLIGDLRALLARTCINALQPDLVLLDEFQRFKHLLAAEDEAGELARELFDWQDEESDAKARVLLMSATPYKMFTLDGEATDDHFRDFIATLEFLAGKQRADEIGMALGELRRELMAFDPAGGDRLDELHAEVEDGLREVIVRTERVGSASDPNAMLRTVPVEPGSLDGGDVQDYLAMQRVARTVSQSDVMEFWKSSPYLMNLLGEGYKLMREVKSGVASAPRARQLAAALAQARLLNPDEIQRWARIDPGNSRMRGLVDDVVGRGTWQMLWMPPSWDYYAPSGAYERHDGDDFTKRLVFSSWNVVPRAIASLVSYAAEREMWKAAEPDALNTQDVRQARRGRLAFAVADGRPTGMPLLALLFPSTVLAAMCDPLQIAGGDDSMRLDEVRKWAETIIRPRVERLIAGAPSDGPADETWYWVTPLLLDAEYGGDEANAWLRRDDAAAAWSGENQEDGRWVDHVDRAQELVASRAGLGRPPADLVSVVAELGLFGWGTTAMRALSRVAIDPVDEAQIRVHSAKVAWALRTLFNLPEVCAFVPAAADGPAYWRQCLSYSAAGGLQSVLDEFAHVLLESLGHSHGDEVALAEISERMASTMTLRATSISADHVSLDGMSPLTIDSMRLRARYGARFGEEASDEGAEVTRPDALRAAFNSPFWPFVLASTSIGQEGLDFHPYCHAVIHWNLPPNPVDLEQREGRVNRYKNHAVRKNVARSHGLDGLRLQRRDPWAAAFEAAVERRPAGENDLVPFWLFPLDGGSVIERRVPVLPLSREVHRYEQLRQSLVVYRMAFGQSRQEDLIAFLTQRFSEADVEALLDRLHIDLRPEAARELHG